MDEVTKEGIIKSLKQHRKQLLDIMKGFDTLDTGDSKTNRIVTKNIMFTMYEFIDSIVNTENDIYNFLKRRG